MNNLKLFCIAVVLLATSCTIKPKDDLLTAYEKSGFKCTPRYDSTIAFCKLLDAKSPWIKYTTFGKSPQGRDLPLLIAGKGNNLTPDAVRKTGKAVLLIQACIHAGEPDGKDAGLMLFRDLITKPEMASLLDNVTILFIPIFNVDGHERYGKFNRINQNGPEEMGWRVNANNFNLNRDYLKADAPEIKQWLALFNEWTPDFFIDCHVTDGADYQYAVTYTIETEGNTNPTIADWIKNSYLKEILPAMESKGLPMFPYVEFRRWHDPRSGLYNWISPAFLSQGYTIVRNRPGLLIETHMLKDYKTRVTGTYELLLETVKFINKNSQKLTLLVSEADRFTASAEFRRDSFPVSFIASKDSTIIPFKGKKYEMVVSDLTGGYWFKYSKEDTTFQIPYFDKFNVEHKIKIPEAYIIPVEWTDIIERVKLHGVKTTTLKNDVDLEVASYKFSNIKFAASPYESRQKVVKYNMEDFTHKQHFTKGSVVIDMEQPLAKLVIYMLEPRCGDSFFSWGFFNNILEQKEYSESYVMEAMAREMIAKNPELKKEFDAKKASDENFAKNADAQLNWFYSRSPYWDDHYCVYPVGKIFDKTLGLSQN